MNPQSSFSLLAALAFAVNANAGSDSPLAKEAPITKEATTDWWEDVNNWSLFDGKITASLNGAMIYGGTSGDMESLYGAGHDPSREGWTVQGIEPSISLRLTDQIEGFLPFEGDRKNKPTGGSGKTNVKYARLRLIIHIFLEQNGLSKRKAGHVCSQFVFVFG